MSSDTDNFKGGLTIGEGVTVTGSVAVPGRLLIHGALEGSARADVIVSGSTGSVAGEMVAREIDVGGTAGESITALESVLIRSTASISGQVGYKVIQIEAGARIQGTLGRLADQIEPPASQPDKVGAALPDTGPRLTGGVSESDVHQGPPAP